MNEELYNSLVLKMSELTVEPVLHLPMGSSQYRAQFLIDQLWPRILAALPSPPKEGLIINPGGENIACCKNCGPNAMAAGKWEGRFFALLAAHERTLRLMEELSDQ